jgi:hypothetical protein
MPTGPVIIVHFPGAPTGTAFPNYFAINDANGDLYDSLAGSWHLVSGGAGSNTHAEPLTDEHYNFIFAAGDVVCVVGVPN